MDGSSSGPFGLQIGSRNCSVQPQERQLEQIAPPDKAWLKAQGLLDPTEEMPEESYNTHPLWTTLASSLVYEERWRSPCKVGQHINILELKAFLKEEKALSRSFIGKRFLAGLDSQVSLGSLVKGRAAAVSLNSMLRSSLCYPLGSGLFGYYMYYASETNRADGPTRHKKPDPPNLPRPIWMQDIVERNDFAAFDCWMDSVEDGVVSKPFDCSLLMNGVELDCRPRQRVRRSDRCRVDRPVPSTQPGIGVMMSSKIRFLKIKLKPSEMAQMMQLRVKVGAILALKLWRCLRLYRRSSSFLEFRRTRLFYIEVLWICTRAPTASQSRW